MIALFIGQVLASDRLAFDPPPSVGQATLVSVTDDLDRPVVGATVMASWRPGLAASREQSLGVTDSLGRIRWTPDASGVVAVSTSGATAPLRVDGAAPGDTLAILGLLALVATGAAAWGARP